MKKKTPLYTILVKEVKRSRGSANAGSLFIIVIIAAMVFMGVGFIGGGTPSLRSTHRPEPTVPKIPTQPVRSDNSISSVPTPSPTQ